MQVSAACRRGPAVGPDGGPCVAASLEAVDVAAVDVATKGDVAHAFRLDSHDADPRAEDVGGLDHVLNGISVGADLLCLLHEAAIDPCGVERDLTQDANGGEVGVRDEAWMAPQDSLRCEDDSQVIHSPSSGRRGSDLNTGMGWSGEPCRVRGRSGEAALRCLWDVQASTTDWYSRQNPPKAPGVGCPDGVEHPETQVALLVRLVAWTAGRSASSILRATSAASRPQPAVAM